MKALAWIWLTLAVLGVLINPFMIGRPKKPETAVDCLIGLVGAATVTVLIGRVLGWW